MNQTSKAKVIPLVDEDGFKLPKNMSKQFRDVQGGIEYLKNAADTISMDLKVVNSQLSANTTDLGEITKKVNTINATLKKHMKQTQKAFESSEKTTDAMLKLIRSVYDIVSK